MEIIEMILAKNYKYTPLVLFFRIIVDYIPLSFDREKHWEIEILKLYQTFPPDLNREKAKIRFLEGLRAQVP